MLTQGTFNTRTAAANKQLEERYPVDNNPLFPGCRIYTNGDGTHRSLDVTNINVWAVLIEMLSMRRCMQ